MHVASSPDLADRGPAVYFSMTLVRAKSCWVSVNALVPAVTTASATPSGVTTEGGVVSSDPGLITPARTRAALLALARDPTIWLQ